MTARAARSSCSKSIRSACATKTASTCAPLRPSTRRTPALLEIRARGLGRERQNARLAAEAVEVRLHGAERRQHLPVRDRQPGRAQLARERVRRHVAAVREDRERAAGRRDPVEHLPRAGDRVHLLGARPVHERAVDVEDEPADAPQDARRHTTRSSPLRTRRYEIDSRRSTSRRRRTSGWRPATRRTPAARRSSARPASRPPAPAASSGAAAAPRPRSPRRSAARAPSRLTGCASRSASTFGSESTRSATSGSGGAANSP